MTIEKYTLENGLRVILNPSQISALVNINVLYNVGAKDESAAATGFAHLFEHFMFSGTHQVPDYDHYVQLAGGENNAFTSNDVTNYYIKLPYNNLELGLFLEADRMRNLAFTQKAFDVQKKVVIEEFKQRYLNKPYGEIWHHLRPMIYGENHPYGWPTIGKKLEHIEAATMDDCKAFYAKYYQPSNAILSISGRFESEEVKLLIAQYFGVHPKADQPARMPFLQPQVSGSLKDVVENVPANAFYMAWPVCKRTEPDYYALDLLSDMLTSGKNARFYKYFLKEKQLVNSISSYCSGSIYEGFFAISGILNEGVDHATIYAELKIQLESLITSLDASELERAKNKAITAIEFEKYGIENKPYNLAFFELIHEAETYLDEVEKVKHVSIKDIEHAIEKWLLAQTPARLNYFKKAQ